MTKLTRMLSLLAAVLLLVSSTDAKTGWNKLFKGKNLDGWSAVGDANWKVEKGIIEATTGAGFLVSTDSYKDFELKAEFWVDDAANSGIFIRCTDPKRITAANAYEVQIFDKRPDQKYATGAIVNVAGPPSPVKSAGKWNTYEITARGGHMIIKLNGAVTADAEDTKNPQGPIALQHAAGLVRFRSVQVRRL